MSLKHENELLRYKADKQQEDIDYLREVIFELKTELAYEKSKHKKDDCIESERGR